jgi:hypothetical protein
MSRGLAGVVVMLVSVNWAFADQKKAEIATIRAQVKELQAEEKLTTKAVRAQYESVLQVGRLTRAQLEEGKAALRNQEKTLLGLTADSDERKSVREQSDLLWRVLNGDVRLDNVLIDRIKKQEKAHVALIHAVYSAKIKEFQNAIRALEQTNTGHVKGRK